MMATREKNGSCCCCMDLKTGCIIIGCLVWASAVFCLTLILMEALNTPLWGSPLIENVLVRAVAVLLTFVLIAATMLLIGICENKPGYLKPLWIMNILVTTVLLGALSWFFFLTFIHLNRKAYHPVEVNLLRLQARNYFKWAVAIAFALGLSMYSCLVLNSYRKLLEQAKKTNRCVTMGRNGADPEAFSPTAPVHDEESTHRGNQTVSPPPSYEQATSNAFIFWSADETKTGPSHISTAADVCTAPPADISTSTANDVCTSVTGIDICTSSPSTDVCTSPSAGDSCTSSGDASAPSCDAY